MKKTPHSLRLFLLLVAIGIVGGATALTGEKTGPKLEYKLVDNWPILEQGMKPAASRRPFRLQGQHLSLYLPFVLVLGKDGSFCEPDGDFTTPHGRIDKNDNVDADMDKSPVRNSRPMATCP